ncbi:MAG: response regulator transcription factor [Dehalococcoidia bacterium]
MAMQETRRRAQPLEDALTHLPAQFEPVRPSTFESPTPRVSLPDGLTPREAEVLGLLATGLSNREIAETLVISVRTVGRHIDNLYGKIGVHDRVRARQYARAHGLTAAPSAVAWQGEAAGGTGRPMPSRAPSEPQRDDQPGMMDQLVMTAISLLLLGGLLFWQLTSGGDQKSADHTAAIGGADAMADRGAAASPIQDLQVTMARGTSAWTGTPTTYIVNSPGQAAEVYAFLEQVRSTIDTGFEQVGPVEVVWFDSPEWEAYFWATHEARHMRDGVTHSVIDLRTADRGSSSMCDIQVGPSGC